MVEPGTGTSNEQLIDEAAAFARSELPASQTVDHFDTDGWHKCARQGVMAVTVPTEFGGRGASVVEFVATMEGLGYGTNRLGLLFAINAHVFGAIEPVCRSATPELKQKYLPAPARGAHIAAHSVTEPTGGSDIQDLKTSAERVDGGWRITGDKRCITCAAAATLHIVYARTGPQSLSCFLVEAQTPDISVEPLASCGLVGCGLGAVHFDNVFVPDENMLGKPGAGGTLFQGSIERERACIWGFVVGAMRRDLEQAVAYANSREIGGAPIASRQAVAHRIADMKVRLDTSRLLLYRAAEAKAAGQRIPLEAAVAKLYISESYVENSISLVRTFGGSGFLTETGVEQSVRDALGGLLFSGTNDIQRNIIAAYLGLKTGG